MNANWKTCISMVVATTLVVVGVVALCWQPVLAQRGEGGGAVSPRYSVHDTEGHNLIVTDNQSNTVYFYTIDKDAKIGSELKLRASIDLKQVGKLVIKPTKPADEK